jgi:tRNA threonylcarbamoyl adenosine modification protein (Sua5/YciO/YrdC/YwlC family)
VCPVPALESTCLKWEEGTIAGLWAALGLLAGLGAATAALPRSAATTFAFVSRTTTLRLSERGAAMSPHSLRVLNDVRVARLRGCASTGAGGSPIDACTVWSGECDADVDAAADALSRGEAVAFPTETVYGLGAMSATDAAVAKIFQAKGRPSDNPLIVHFSDGHAGLRLLAAGGKVPPEATALAEAFWPGPLSICIRANTANVCTTCRAGLDTVAVRVPDHPVALKLLRALDKKMGAATGVAAPSANASGRPSPTEALHVLQDLGHGGKIAGVVDGGRSCSIGIESTVVGDICYSIFVMFILIL